MTYSFSQYRAQYKSNLRLALPIAMTQIGQILTQIADNLMIGRYGGENPIPLAAVSFGGMVFFILFIAAIGITMGITPLVGELFAQHDRQKSAGLLQNGILFFSLFGLMMAAVQYALIPLLYHMGQPVEVVDAAIPYYRMLVYGMPFVMLFFVFKQFLEGVGNTKTVLVVSMATNLLNVLLNWVFIYGHFGLPAMGPEGAGLSTTLSRAAAATAMVTYFYSHPKYRGYLEGFNFVRLSLAKVKSILRIGLPISLQMFLEASAFVGTSIMMGWFSELGAAAISGNQIAATSGNCSFMLIMSVGAATTIRVSHCYGRRDIGELAVAAKASLHLVLMFTLVTALCFISLRHLIPTLFTANADAIAITSHLLIFSALYQLPDGIQNVSIGILRGIQDVKIIMPIAFVAYWLLNLPVGYLLGFVLGMGPAGLYLGFSIGLGTAAILLLLRIRRRVRALRAEN